MNEWENIPEDIKEYQGFTYVIADAEGKYYLGKKNYWFKKIKKVNGKRKHYVVESDWKTYLGSSNKFQEYVKKKGEDKFRRIMIHHCKNKFELAYWEADTQFEWAVLFDKNSFNECINLRIRKDKGDIIMTRAETKREAILRDYVGENKHKKRVKKHDIL